MIFQQVLKLASTIKCVESHLNPQQLVFYNCFSSTERLRSNFKFVLIYQPVTSRLEQDGPFFHTEIDNYIACSHTSSYTSALV